MAITQVAIIATTVYLHRSLSHRALRLSPAVEMCFRSILWLTTGIKRQEWVGIHRLHHAYTDVEGDPHSPVIEGYWRIQLLNVVYYRRAAKRRASIQRYTRDLPLDWLDRNVFSRSLAGLAIGIALLVLLFGPVMGALIALLHLCFYLTLSGAINAIGHTFGKRPFDNLATNNQWLALLTFGEGLHNNHHELPTSAKLSTSRSQVDPGWYFILLLRRLGLAKVRMLRRDRQPT